ncbi:MAG: hypothetical protein K2J08_04290 [Ruminococcus sp.]|nr:hypothetical protein [Ruminococcus sp.]
MDNQTNQNPNQSPISGCAVASLILGIIALMSSCCLYYLSIPLAVIGTILGAVGIKSGKSGRGMGIAGIVCCIISLVPSIIVIVTGSAIISSFGSIS